MAGNFKTALTLERIVRWSDATTDLSATALRARVPGAANDSRSIKPGELFVAIKTGHDDGHRYVENALSAGAVSALANRGSRSGFAPATRGKILFVNDTVEALQTCAREYRKAMGILFIGITGSSGKTTTRACITAVLKQAFDVGGTAGNLNNHIGVPLSILRFTGREYVGIIEMGANHIGEIDTLSRITMPDIAIVTNIGYGHVGLFGSIANTTKAKLEIVNGLNRKGFLLINGDDKRLTAAAEKLPLKAYRFGFSSGCDLRVDSLTFEKNRSVSFTANKGTYRLSMPARHFVYDALPAIFLGRRLGIDNRQIAAALAGMKPISLRGAIRKKAGITFIVDCYNANPSSMEGALEMLAVVAGASRRIAVLGDMLELGRYAAGLHKRLGQRTAASGLSGLVFVGAFAQNMALAAIASGMDRKNVYTNSNPDEALHSLKKIVKKGDTVLLKASRGVKLEKVFEEF